MSFASSIYKVYLPILRVGHYLRIGTAYYTVAKARLFPYPTGNITGTGSRYDFKDSTNSNYQVLHGNLDQKRVVHLRYLALETTEDTYIYWLTDPFTGTKEVEIPINSNYAPKTNPLEFNKWSYSREMYASAKWASGNTQAFIWEVAIYIVEPARIKPREYLMITDEGDATFVKALGR